LVGERLVTQGTFLGYQVRGQNQPTESTAIKPQAPPSDIKACNLVSIEDIGKILGSPVSLPSVGFPDTTTDPQLSVCSLVSKQKPSRSVTIILRQYKNVTDAEKAIKAQSNKAETVSVSGPWEQGYYAQGARQLAVKIDNNLLTVTVSETTQSSAIQSKDATYRIAEFAVTALKD
jgi:hypothetical protein